MITLESYLKKLNEQTGWLNFQEDRYLILNKYKVSSRSCLRIQSNTLPGRVQLYQCQINAANQALQNIQMALNKCQNTQYPEKCQDLYNRMVGPLEQKIKWYENEIANLQRKGGMVQY